jgi:amidophosphoribosyltransferase
LRKACGEGPNISYCSACYTGNYPTEIIDVEDILPAGVRR